MSRELLAAEQSFAAIYRTVGALENYLHLAAALLVAKDAGLQLAAGRAHLPLLLGAALAAACSGAASRKGGSSAWPASACCKRRSASAARAPATAEPPPSRGGDSVCRRRRLVFRFTSCKTNARGPTKIQRKSTEQGHELIQIKRPEGTRRIGPPFPFEFVIQILISNS